MRKVIDTAIGLIFLLGLSWAYWQYRYESHAGDQPVAFHPGGGLPSSVARSPVGVDWNSSSGVLSLLAVDGKPARVEVDLGAWPRDGYAHLRVEGKAVGLVRGRNVWDSGRVSVIWRDEAGSVRSGCSVFQGERDNEAWAEDVIVPLGRSGRPSIVLQNLGVSGLLAIERMEASLVCLRWWAVPAGVGLLIAWFVWSYVSLGEWIGGAVGKGRLAVAGVLAVTALYFMILPGPWMPYRPMMTPFAISTRAADDGASLPPCREERLPKAVSAARNAPGPSVAMVPLPGEVPGKLKIGRFWELVYAMKSFCRPLLHLSIFGGCTVVLAFLLRTRSAAWPVVMLALATEAIEALLGFGFDRNDVGDLISDGVGIWLGAWVVGLWLSRVGAATAGGMPETE